MKIKFRNPRVFTFLLTLLLLGGVANQAWAYKVTYHILTLPINNSVYHMTGSEGVFEGKRIEAVRVVDNNATTVNLPDAYKSPLAKEFKYYASTDVTSHDAVAMYNFSGKNKAHSYEIKAGAADIGGNTVSANMEVYVTYEYDNTKEIKLDGSEGYNLTMSGGFLGFNRGRNNRMAVIKKELDIVHNDALVSEDFVKLPSDDKNNVIPGTKISTFWQSNDNKNTKSYVAGQFHFIFKFEGSDPYNIIISTAYDRDYAYLEKHGSENSQRYKWYKGSHLFRPTSEKGYFMASDDHKRYTTSSNTYNPDPMPDIASEEVSGYFKTKSTNDLTYNTFALLNNSHSPSDGYVFMLSNFVDGSGEISTPSDYKSAKYYYLTRDGDFNNLTYGSMTLADATKNYSTDDKIYRIQKYVYKVTKKISGGELAEKLYVSEYFLGEDPVNFIPESLRRKYVTYKAYSDAGFTNEITTFTQAAASCVDDGSGSKVIYLKYEANMPFETWTEAGGSDTDGNHAPDYDELTWYNIRANKNAAYILSWDGSKVVTRNVASKYPRTTHFALIGDPYDLKIVGRTSSQNGSGNPSALKYMELNATLENNATFETTGTIWGIVYDDDTADNRDCFRLKDNSGDKYLHIKDDSGDNYPLNGTAASADAVRITVDELPKMNYTYYIMRSDNSVAVWTSGGSHEPSAKLDYNQIPQEIRSPFLNDPNISLTFYGGTTDKATAISNAENKTSPITYAPDTNDGGVQHIVVRYDDYAEHGSTVSYINGTQNFNVRLNGQYIYYDKNEGVADAERIKSSSSIETDDKKEYIWTLGGSDPYAMTIKPSSVSKYIKIDSWPVGDEAGAGAATSWSDDPPTSKYIIKSSTEEHTYEVMAATGGGDTYDAFYETFNFGRTDENTVKMYSDGKYISGSDVLRFELIATDAVNVTYHLVDIKNKTELLSVQTRQESTAAPSFPPEYRSPLVATYTYWKTLDNAKEKSGDHPATVDADGDNNIYVTYTANDLVDMSGRTMYLMRFALGDQFRQEDGSDGLLAPMSEFTGDDAAKKYKYQAVYPYCNGDCNFFVYGQEQYDEQQQGAASTRTRWAWYVESVKNDPYHVKIRSRQQETYPAGSGNDYNAYFRTYVENYATTDGGTKSNHVVTTLAWPGISGEQGTEYMVLGSEGQFRLVTSDEINDGTTTARRAVNSFEQYWKTWNTIRKIVLGDKDAVAKQSDPNTVPATPATAVATEANKDNRTYLTEVMGWHSYENWAYAIRWNDYNKAGDKNKKGWEALEHWYQTVNMGEGYFDFVKTTIDPVLILLDQHGWEVMRKPLPSSPTDPDKDAKYDAIRPYDSPMVKEYHFWTKTSKRTGFHQYYNLSQRVTVDGEPFASTSLTNLPPYEATNVHDAKGNLLDQYVTYVVKDEYVKSLGNPFMIQQGKNFVYNNSDAIGMYDLSTTTGGMSQYIIENASDLTDSGSKKNELWYLKPNANIDDEMGYANYAHDWTNDYTKTDFSESGFDPYNIQISSVSNGEKFFVTNATKAEIDEGSILGDGTTNTLGGKASVNATLVGGMDNRTLQMTNATFMAVQDKNGNMQLMPRFDQEKRLKDFSALVHTDDTEETKTHTKLYRPLVYNYHIIDNSGQEALRYQGGGDLVPQTPEWFKSPLAKDYKYYKNLTKDGDVYTEVKNKTDISAKEITESLEGAAPTGYDVYVRYSYDETADYNKILQGKWLTMKVNNLDAQYTTVSVTAGIYSGTKPDPVEAKEWQWKFTANSQTAPDPYAVSLYNRNTDAGTATPVNSKSKFALLNWYNGVVDASAFTLAVHGLGTVDNYDYTYQFVNGASMDASTAATTATEANVKSTSCTYTAGAKIELNDEVSHSYTYKVYTNGGVFAVSADQDNNTASENDYIPVLPEEIKSPLLNIDQFKYYGAEADMGDETKELKNIFGLYEDNIYVRYTDYDLKATEYQVPNVKTVVDSKVARDESSNDAALDINGELLYNIIWYNDNMMQSTDNSAITGLASQPLQGGDAYIWQFEGNDPYAIKIKHKKADKYVKQDTGDADGDSNTNECMLANEATTFMLLPSTDAWQYGVLQVTGDSDGKKLTGVGDNLTADAGTGPTKFIIFGLSTHKVIYHLVIANIGGHEDIPYYNTSTKDFEESHAIAGSTMRDLNTTYQLGSTISIGGSGVNYCVDEGHITLGDPLKVPEALKRPNCKYFYYVGGIYDNEACTTTTESTDLNTKYKGHEITQMGTEPALLGKTVVINVVYAFDDGLPTNNGANFVTNTTGTQWFTTETNDETPYLARITYEGTIQSAEGREPHYTNEFLWKPVGDPYGFKMYNRYTYKNAGKTSSVMTTTDTPADGQSLTLGSDTSPNSIYELFTGETDGYFIMRPMLNNNVAIYNNAGTMTLSATNATEWTFGLSETLFKPYRDRAGYVGGLNDTGKTAYDEAAGNLQTIQGIVYNDANIVSFAPGYYRLHNLPNTNSITTPRYMSGYLHEIEKTYVSGGIPMHFYSRMGVNTTFEALGSGYTTTPATQGQIPVLPTEYDPSSIFYITVSASGAQMHTQGLNVIGNKMGTDEGTSFHIVDIGGACVVIYDGSNNYLSYNGTNKYDIGYDAMTASVAERSKWCLEPANNMGLYIKTNSGGEEETLTNLWYYSSYCVPFDLLIADKDGADKDHSSNAYTCVEEWEEKPESPWSEDGLHPKSIGKYNTEANGCPVAYRGSDYFVPAGTPVLFSTKRAKEYIKATIPTTAPSTSISTIFSYQYLEQVLTPWDNTRRVYVFGPKMQGTMEINTSDGTVNATLPSLGNTNVGFHLNANPNKEAGLTPASWTRHNYYVLHNRIYYKAGGSGASPAPTKRAPEFVPVIFDDEEEQQELNPNGTMEGVGDGCIYDLMGRKVATREQVEDGSWKQRVATGIYILNGRKFQKK